MTNVTEVIHEVIAVLCFVAAVTLLVLLTNTGNNANRAVDIRSRERTNIVEGEDAIKSRKVLVSGAEVYSDVIDYVTNDVVTIDPATSKMEVVITNAASGLGQPGDTLSTGAMQEIKNTNASKKLLERIDLNAKYIKDYSLDTSVTRNGNVKISAVIYRKQA